MRVSVTFMSADSERILYSVDKKLLPSISHIEHAQKLIDLCCWLNDKGIKTLKSRLPIYIKYFESLAKNTKFNPKNADDDRQLFDRLLYTIREVHELMWIYDGFKGGNVKGDTDLLKIILGGHPFAKDDTDTRARNFQFELRIASYFLQAKYAVNLSLQAADIVAESVCDKFIVECKRLQSPVKVGVRINETAQQLIRRLSEEKEKNVYGVAVFDVTGLGIPNQGFIGGVTYNHCKDIIQNKLKAIDETYDFTTPFLKDKNIILVWLQIHIPALNFTTGQPMTRFSSLYNSLTEFNYSKYRAQAFERLKTVLEIGKP